MFKNFFKKNLFRNFRKINEINKIEDEIVLGVGYSLISDKPTLFQEKRCRPRLIQRTVSFVSKVYADDGEGYVKVGYFDNKINNTETDSDKRVYVEEIDQSDRMTYENAIKQHAMPLEYPKRDTELFVFKQLRTQQTPTFQH